MKIKKSKLEAFISRYSLKKENESVKFAFNKELGTISTRAISGDKLVLAEVQMNGILVEETIDVGVYDTTKLSNLLRVLTDDEIDMSLIKNENSGKVVAIKLSDSKVEVNCMSAELSAIPKVPTVKEIASFKFGMSINQEFCKSLDKAKSALSEEKYFTLVPTDNGVKFIIGYAASANSNRVKLDTVLEVGKESLDKEMTYSAEFLNDVLKVNKSFFIDDKTVNYFRISEKGAAITFSTDEFKCVYYFVPITNK